MVAALYEPHTEEDEMAPSIPGEPLPQCLSFKRDLCPPLNFPFLNETEQRDARRGCGAT